MTQSELFKTTQLGPYTLKNRIVLPPLTRSRSSQPGNIPNDLMATSAKEVLDELVKWAQALKPLRG